ncbi:MAG TPA: 30S ribosomal protein S5 [Candidatus Altiarchaeales archaeon]|nr:30S ribosomal protein S5 [Candidatus Altiarchaeales archaeon]
MSDKDEKPVGETAEESEKTVKKAQSKPVPAKDSVDEEVGVTLEIDDDSAAEEEVEVKAKKVKLTRDEEYEAERKRLELEALEKWVPKTKLGRMVKDGEIKTMHEAVRYPAPIREVEIVDKLLPGIEEAVLNVGRVQRTTDSGRRMRFRVVVAVGNRDGYVGIGVSKGKDAGPTIRNAIRKAKLSLIEVKRGCGSWECGCGKPHTVPFKVSGKSGSVEILLKPAPRGVGLVSGEIARQILGLAGINDVFVNTSGHTRTAINFTKAVVDALEKTNYLKVDDKKAGEVGIVVGACEVRSNG